MNRICTQYEITEDSLSEEELKALQLPELDETVGGQGSPGYAPPRPLLPGGGFQFPYGYFTHR